MLRETRRLVLHRFETAAQSQALADFLSDPEVARHLLVSFDPQRGLAPNGERFRKNFAAAWERFGFGGCLVSPRGREDSPLGFVALKGHVREGAEVDGAFEVYFGLARPAWGRGLATEALSAYLAELDLRLRPVSVHACLNRAQNPAACRVLEKLGFGFERWLPLPEFVRGELARGSVEVELHRIAAGAPGRPPEAALSEAAFRVGQLLASVEGDEEQAQERLLEAARGGGALAALGAAAAGELVRRSLSAGRGEARYAVYRRRAALAGA